MSSKFYSLKAKNPKGEEVEMSQFQGKALLIVNTATKCGLAPQFDGLEKLHQEFKDSGFQLLGFPCNQFLGQEPETNDTVEEACRINHGVSFPLMALSDVNGRNTNSVFKYLKSKTSGFLGSAIKWNFTKFLVDQVGKSINRYSPQTKPSEIRKDIRALLSKKLQKKHQSLKG